MALMFYPHNDDAQRGTLDEQIDLLMEAAERYRVAVQEVGAKESVPGKRMAPKDLVASYNWEEIAFVLRGIRDLPEGSKSERLRKAGLLTKLAEIYEVLRSAKMSKLEAVRLALIGEANHLQSGG